MSGLIFVVDTHGLTVPAIMDRDYYPPYDATLQARVRTATAVWEINRLPNGACILTCMDALLGMVYAEIPQGLYTGDNLAQIIRLNGHDPEVDEQVARLIKEFGLGVNPGASPPTGRCQVPCAHRTDVHDCPLCASCVAFDCCPLSDERGDA